MMARDTLAFRTLLEVAGRRSHFDVARCRLVLEFLGTAAAVQTALEHDLDALDLTERKLAVLVVLFMLDPAPSTPADLAVHTGATRSAMTDVVDQLEARALVRRQRDNQDRRLIYIHLTEAGRRAADTALTRYLEGVGRIARLVQIQSQPQLLDLCAELNAGATNPSLQS